ncbi:MAG: hypothetical protein OQK98_01110 [Gammaproteobacteria bacterium]|nr:hypothetical protein [Gammaproteobacteria bacterium]
MIHDNLIRVGAYGWDQLLWQGTFFPDDLPIDWRLSYYANEFSAVLVPEIKWREAADEIESWADDVPDDFRFYFLNSHIKSNDHLAHVTLGNKFGGFVDPQANTSVALINVGTKSLREWKDWLQVREFEAIFLMDDGLRANQLLDFKALLELMNL